LSRFFLPKNVAQLAVKGEGGLGSGVRAVLVFSGLYQPTCEDAVGERPSGHKTAIWPWG